ncbi:MAG: class I SAM-dependent methyltransferase [Gemmatimonadota bacterium]|nr:class I SAM-dependent methyltransferase [Gemmatimonadota bacterium]
MKGVRVDPERRETRMLRRHVPFSGARVLDIGCGDGRLSNRIRGWIESIVGVDQAGEDVGRAHARKRLDGIARFAVADASRLPFQDRSFDLALYSWSL